MISQQLNGDFEEALETYDGLMRCIKTDGATGPEKSQTVMHVVKIRIEAGKLGEALQRLETGFREGIVSPRGEATQLKGMTLLDFLRHC